MKKSIIMKFLIIICLILTIFIFNTNYVFAISDIISGADDFIKDGVKDDSPVITDDRLEEMSDLLYNSLLIIAIVIAVIVGLVIAIQFMTGSVSQKAKIKETLIPYVAGCIVIFGAFGIWKLVVTILSSTA